MRRMYVMRRRVVKNKKKSDHCLRLSSEGAEVSITLIWQTSQQKSGFDILLIFITFRNKKKKKTHTLLTYIFPNLH